MKIYYHFLWEKDELDECRWRWFDFWAREFDCQHRCKQVNKSSTLTMIARTNEEIRLLQNILMKDVEHLSDSDRWKKVIRLFLHDENKIVFIECIKIKDLVTKLYLYQVFNIFVMIEMKMWQNDEYLADEMRLEKTCNSNMSWKLLY